MERKSEVARRIVERREALRVSQERVAREAEISSQTVGRIERGESEPKIETLRKIARALDTTVGYLVGETPFPEAPGPLPATGTEGN
jgi:transcriptional regulator with XRE-family HTH domain